MRGIGEGSHSGGASEHILLYVTLFVAAAVISTSLLLFAAVIYLGDLLGSLVLSLVIVGAVMALVAWSIYRGALRPLFRSIGEQLQTIYAVASAAEVGYNWILGKVESLIRRL
ncbi:MAG: hypothetical protein SNG14_03530 [Rikenellaceae bacterium]